MIRPGLADSLIDPSRQDSGVLCTVVGRRFAWLGGVSFHPRQETLVSLGAFTFFVHQVVNSGSRIPGPLAQMWKKREIFMFSLSLDCKHFLLKAI